MTVICIAGAVASLLITLYIFSTLFLTLAGIFIIGSIFFPWWKGKRFGPKNRNLAERVVKLEGAIGVDV